MACSRQRGESMQQHAMAQGHRAAASSLRQQQSSGEVGTPAGAAFLELRHCSFRICLTPMILAALSREW
jgi:hypothetical protein